MDFVNGAMRLLPATLGLAGCAGRSQRPWAAPPSPAGAATSDTPFPSWQGEESRCLRVGDAYVLVYSVTDRGSFESASELRIQLRRARQAEDIPIILVGNKSDLVRCREVSVEGERWWGGGLARGDPCARAPCPAASPTPCPLVPGCHRGRVPSLPFPLQRAGPAPWCLTASSSRHRRLYSTTWPSSSRGWCGRSACAAAAGRPPRAPRPAGNARRASPREPGASSTGWWPGTAAKWPSKPAPSPATTCPCSESRCTRGLGLSSLTAAWRQLHGEPRQGWSDAEDVELL